MCYERNTICHQNEYVYMPRALPLHEEDTWEFQVRTFHFVSMKRI